MHTEEVKVVHTCPEPGAYSEKHEGSIECRFALLEDLWVIYKQESRRWLEQSCG